MQKNHKGFLKEKKENFFHNFFIFMKMIRQWHKDDMYIHKQKKFFLEKNSLKDSNSQHVLLDLMAELSL